MHCLRNAACLVLAASDGLGLPALAQGRIPDMQQAGALRYSCGGIGEDESTLMRAAMKDYPLSLLFAQKDGAYLANVAVEVSSGKDSSRFIVLFSGISRPCRLPSSITGPIKVSPSVRRLRTLMSRHTPE